MTYQKYIVAARVRRRLRPGTIARIHQTLDRSFNT
jgi:hypothetical protein